MSYTVCHHINGSEYREKADCKNQDLYNPALGEICGTVQLAGRETCDYAVKSALQAWPAWAATVPLKRARILFNFRDLLEKNQQKLAELVTMEHGKTLEDARGSLARAIEVVELHCGILTQLQGSFSANVAQHIDCQTIRQPLGVCVGVSPFNFPIMVPVWMMMPALACGNTFILKPSEQVPSSTLYLFDLLKQAGLPAGVANCVNGDRETVEYLIAHPNVSACTAVASTPVAENIYKTATAHGKRAHTFGGAKNHCVLMPDADIDQAASAIVGASFGSAGERCMAISVVVAVGDNTADRLLEKLIPLTQAIRINAGDKADTDMGPLISKIHRERIIAALDEGVAEGASLLIDGRSFKQADHPQGYFLGPSLFDHVSESMSVYQNEIFGPVLVILRVDTFEEALALVNRHQYGNGTAIFTRDGYTAREYSQRVQAGMVGINIPIPVPIASHPFGGWKRSSFGDTIMHGTESIHFYTRSKSIVSRWPQTDLNNSSFAMPTH